MNLERGEARGEIRRNFWSQRVVDPWNSLPDSVKESVLIDTFKNCIDNLLAKERNGQRLATLYLFWCDYNAATATLVTILRLNRPTL